MLPWQTLAFTIHGKNIKRSHKNNKLKISPPARNEEFELPDGSYSISNIDDYFEYTLKKHETVADNPSIRIYINKIENRITFKINTGYSHTFNTRNNITRKLSKVR